MPEIQNRNPQTKYHSCYSAKPTHRAHPTTEPSPNPVPAPQHSTPLKMAAFAPSLTLTLSTFRPALATARPSLSATPRHTPARMQTTPPPTESDDSDSGDGFMGESDFNEAVGVPLPPDMSASELQFIKDAVDDDDRFDRLKVIAKRKNDIRLQARRDTGQPQVRQVGSYLDNLK